jgi:hypothetical protein
VGSLSALSAQAQPGGEEGKVSDDEEAIMAADDPGYLSPVDGHMHYAVRNRQECAVCMLELERDSAMRVLRDFVERVATAAGVSLTWDEADQVGEPGTPKYNDRLISDVEHALAERDRLREALDAILDGLVGLDSDDAYVALSMEHLNVVRAALRKGRT